MNTISLNQSREALFVANENGLMTFGWLSGHAAASQLVDLTLSIYGGLDGKFEPEDAIDWIQISENVELIPILATKIGVLLQSLDVVESVDLSGAKYELTPDLRLEGICFTSACGESSGVSF